tara:strand:+ start:26 stop:232 length:207 start_codon:yes stop_codon:yes gene_type:complete
MFFKGEQVTLAKKVLAWRVISVSLTLLITFIFTGDVKSASTLTLVLQGILFLTHWLFEYVWETKSEKR